MSTNIVSDLETLIPLVASPEQQRQAFAGILMALPKQHLDWLAFHCLSHPEPQRNSAEFLRQKLLDNDTETLRGWTGYLAHRVLVQDTLQRLDKEDSRS